MKTTINGWKLKQGRAFRYWHKGNTDMWIAKAPSAWTDRGKWCVAVSSYDNPPSMRFAKTKPQAVKYMKSYLKKG